MRFLAVLAAILLSSAATAAEPYKTGSIMLLQPDFVLEERVPSVDSLSDYIKAVEAAAANALAGEEPHAASGFLVLAVRPGRRSMVWVNFEPDLPASIADKLRTAILAVPAFEARGGVVVFALNSSLWGAPASQGFPNPDEWVQAMEGNSEPVEIGDLVDKVWPDGSGS